MNQDAHLSTKSKVLATIGGAALEPFVYFVISPLFVMIVGTEPKNVAGKALFVAVLSFGAWSCLLVLIALRLKKRTPGLARYFVLGALIAMAVMMVLPFLELAFRGNPAANRMLPHSLVSSLVLIDVWVPPLQL